MRIHPRVSIISYRHRSMTAEYFVFSNGRYPVHHAVSCVGFCPLHNPSDHVMRNWERVRRMTGLIERLCPEHGTGHPDPDSVRWMEANSPYEGNRGTWGIHGCCGCCRWPLGSEMAPHPLEEEPA